MGTMGTEKVENYFFSENKEPRAGFEPEVKKHPLFDFQISQGQYISGLEHHKKWRRYSYNITQVTSGLPSFSIWSQHPPFTSF